MDGYTYNKNSVLEKYDQEPTEYSHNLVNSGNIQKYVDAADALVDAKVDQMIARVGNPFVFKGTKATTSALPSSGNTVNDTWFVTETGFMYTWNGTSWDQTSTDVNNQLSRDIATVYSETKADYKHGDLVLYNNQVYMRKNDATQADGAFVSSNWTAISIGDRVRELQSDVEDLFASPFDFTLSYNEGDYVIYNDNFYRAKTDISADTAWSTSNWEQVTVDTELHRRDDSITDLKGDLGTHEKLAYKVIVPNNRNLFSSQQIIHADGWSYINNEYYGPLIGLNYFNTHPLQIFGGWEQGKRYTFTFEYYREGAVSTDTLNGGRFEFHYTDGTSSLGAYLTRSNSEYTYRYISSEEGKTVRKLIFVLNAGQQEIYHIRNLQIVKGVARTEYIPFELSSVDVKVRSNLDNNIEVGKNLFDSSQLLAIQGCAVDEDEFTFTVTDIINAFGADSEGLKIFRGFKANTQYTLSFDVYTNLPSNSGNTIILSWMYDDNTYSRLYIPASNSSDFIHKSLTSTENKTVVKLCVLLSSNPTNILHIKNIQIEEGNKYTLYEPFELSVVDVNQRQKFLAAQNFMMKEANIKWHRGALNANGVISSSNCAVTFLPKQTIKVQISEGYQATIGLYDSDGAWLGKINTHYGLDSISGNWMTFSGVVDISDILQHFKATYCSLCIADSTFTTNTIVWKTLLSICKVYCYNYDEKDEIPAYFNESLTNAISHVNSDTGSCGKNGFSFIFITDIHWASNCGHSPALVKAIQMGTDVQDVILGGDLIDGGTDKQIEYDLLRNVADKYLDSSWDRRYCFGNHDSNTVGQTSYPERFLSQGDVYAATQQNQKYDVVYSEDGYSDYYWDDNTSKTRIIVIDSKIEGVSIYPSQISWLNSVLASTNNEYKIIIIMHIWYQLGDDDFGLSIATQGQQICDVVDDWNTDHDAPKVIAMFGGHVHRDANYITTTGVPVVLTTCDVPSVYSDVTKVSEQAIDVITINYSDSTINCRRVGRGVDREFTYNLI